MAAAKQLKAIDWGWLDVMTRKQYDFILQYLHFSNVHFNALGNCFVALSFIELKITSKKSIL